MFDEGRISSQYSGLHHRRASRRTLLRGVLAAGATTAAGAAMLQTAGFTGAAQSEPLRIGVTFGLTGPGAFVANAGADGITLASEEINANGGVLGRQIELAIQDSRGQPTEAITILRRFASDGIRLIIGPQTSTEVLAALPVVQELQVVDITTMSTNPSISQQQGEGGNPWMFRVNPPDDSMARTLVQIAVEQLGDERIATVARNDDLGRGATEAFTSSVQEFGGEIISSDFFQSGGSYDFSSTLTQLRSETPDAVVFVGTIEEGIPFIRQFYEQGLEARIYTRGVSITQELYDQLGSQLVSDLHAIEPYFAEIDTPQNEAFVALWQERFDVDPINQGYYSYAAMHMMADAVNTAGSDEPEAVREALSNTVYEGVTGELRFDEFNQAHANVYVGRIDCEGDDCGVSVIASAPTS